MENSLLSTLDEIVERNRAALSRNVEKRRSVMEQDSVEHLKLYELLGFPEEEGRKVDLYQNIGRFIYKYAGSLIEEATVAVLKYSKVEKAFVLSTQSVAILKLFKLIFSLTKTIKPMK